jgi:hypothetical protein
MKVSECKECKYYERRKYSTSYKPANYHTISVSHVYAYCKKHNKRCLKVKKCEEQKRGE